MDIKEKIRFEVTKACASTWKNTIDGLSGKGSIQNGMHGTVDNILEIIKQHCSPQAKEEPAAIEEFTKKEAIDYILTSIKTKRGE